jgi:hypothetical protein
MRKAIWVLLAAGTAVEVPVAAQARNRATAPPAKTLNFQAGRKVVAPDAEQPMQAAMLRASPATLAGEAAPQGLRPLRIERERSAFLVQTRVPLVRFWNGRVEVACVHQRLRSVHTHSAVAVADGPALMSRGNAGQIPARSRSSIGGGIWLRWGGHTRPVPGGKS